MMCAIPGLYNHFTNGGEVHPCARCGCSALLHTSYASTKCQNASCTCEAYMLLGRIQPTEEKYITYDMKKKKFRVVIKGKHVAYTMSLLGAKDRRDQELNRLGIT